MVDIVVIVSIISSVFSIILAIFAILFSLRVENRVIKNFIILKDNQDQNRKQIELIKKTMDQSHETLHETIKDLKD